MKRTGEAGWGYAVGMRTRMMSVGVLAACLGGCGFHTPPTLKVADLKLSERSAEEAVLTLVIEATNHTDEALPLSDTAYELRINGETVFRGDWDAQATAPVEGSVRFELPAVVASELLPAGGQAEYAVRGTVEYIPPGALGEALFNARVRKGSASFGERGQLRVGGD